MLRQLAAQIVDIDIPLLITGHRHHSHASHHGTGWIGAMGTRGNQAHIAMALASCLMPGANHQQTRELPLGPCIRLQRHTGETGELSQPALEVLRHAQIAFQLVSGGKGVNAPELPPAHRRQLRCRIELHGAATKRNHPVHQRKVFADQTLDVAKQLGLTAIAVKHRLLQPGVETQR